MTEERIQEIRQILKDEGWKPRIVEIIEELISSTVESQAMVDNLRAQVELWVELWSGADARVEELDKKLRGIL